MTVNLERSGIPCRRSTISSSSGTSSSLTSAPSDTPTKEAWLWSRDCYKMLPIVVTQRVERVCQRQLSYLFLFVHNADV